MVRMVSRRRGGLSVYTYAAAPGVPPVTAMRLNRDSVGKVEPEHAHAHDFPLLVYVERGGVTMRLGDREWRMEAGDLYLIAPGEVLALADARDFAAIEAWTLFFTPEVFGSQAPGAFLAWRAHPLLFPFVRGAAGGVQRLKVPPGDRRAWTERLSALDRELHQRRDGYREAILAYLTLLLVDVGRLAADIVGDLRLNNEPLLAEVFSFIDRYYGERTSLKDVARSVSLSPGHLTTLVRRKTGRTVQEWIGERRMAEARRLLIETDLVVEEVGRLVGYEDPGYFARSFRRAHNTTPRSWRRTGRP